MLATGEGVFELTGFSEDDLIGRDVVEALGLSDSAASRSCANGACRKLEQQLSLRTRAGIEKQVTGDFFPAYDDDGGLLVALTPRLQARRRQTPARRAEVGEDAASQRGRRASQTRRPCQISRCGKRAQSSRGTSRIRSRSIFTGSSCRVNPSRCESRRTCVSTTIPCALPRSAETTFAVLRATPGSRSSVVEARSAPRRRSSSIRIRIVPRSDFAFCR